jgi:regulatory protein
LNNTRFTPLQAWEKIKSYCAYQERCHSQVKSELYDFGLITPDVDQLLSRLIEAGYLNEERFAIQFAGGHFRLKKWGKVKIADALRQLQVSAYCIKMALQQLPADDYAATLHKVAEGKWQQVAKGTPASRWAKTQQFLLQKGFEADLVRAALQVLAAGNRLEDAGPQNNDFE